MWEHVLDASEAPETISQPTRRPKESAREPLPFVYITGTVYPGEPSWTDPQGRRAALNRWCDRIGKKRTRINKDHNPIHSA